MARRHRVRPYVFAALAGASAATGQLGLCYGLGIMAWSPRVAGADGARLVGGYSANLTWSIWIAATSVVVGALVGDRLVAPVRGSWVRQAICRLAIAIASGTGAAVTIVLVAAPARLAATMVAATKPQPGPYAAVGVVVGVLLATMVLASRAIEINVLSTAGWLWLLAIVAAIDGITSASAFGQLGVWKFTDSGPVWHSFYLPGSLLSLGAALLIGGLSALPAAIRGDGRLAVTFSGAIGPIMIAFAYVLAQPMSGQVPVEQLSAAITAPYAVIAGLLGSAMVAAVGSVPAKAFVVKAGDAQRSAVSSRPEPPAVAAAAVAVASLDGPVTAAPLALGSTAEPVAQPIGDPPQSTVHGRWRHR